MEKCESCEQLQNDLDALQEKYDALYKVVDDNCYDIKKAVEEIVSNL